MRPALILILLMSLVAAACGGARQIDVSLASVNGSGVSGLALLTASGNGTTARLELAGLRPDAAYIVRLKAGAVSEPSASFTEIAKVIVGSDGRGSAVAPVTFRGEPIAIETVADGTRVLVVELTDGGTVAASEIPALR
jgi:hypothetical protein